MTVPCPVPSQDVCALESDTEHAALSPAWWCQRNSFAHFPGGFQILKPYSNESHKDEYEKEISAVPQHSGKLPPYKPLTQL